MLPLMYFAVLTQDEVTLDLLVHTTTENNIHQPPPHQQYREYSGTWSKFNKANKKQGIIILQNIKIFANIYA